MRYAEFVVPLVKAVQELNIQNAQLNAEIEELYTLIDMMSARLKQVEESRHSSD